MIRSSKFASITLALTFVCAVAGRSNAQQGPSKNTVKITDPAHGNPNDPGYVPPNIPASGNFDVKGLYDSMMDPSKGGVGIVVKVFEIVNGNPATTPKIYGDTSAALGTSGGNWTATVKNQGTLAKGLYYLRATLKKMDATVAATDGFIVQVP